MELEGKSFVTLQANLKELYEKVEVLIKEDSDPESVRALLDNVNEASSQLEKAIRLHDDSSKGEFLIAQLYNLHSEKASFDKKVEILKASHQLQKAAVERQVFEEELERGGYIPFDDQKPTTSADVTVVTSQTEQVHLILQVSTPRPKPLHRRIIVFLWKRNQRLPFKVLLS